MTRIVLLTETERVGAEFDRALKMLGPKVLAYDPVEHWLMVRKIEADAVIRALDTNGITAEIREIPSQE